MSTKDEIEIGLEKVKKIKFTSKDSKQSLI